MIAGNYENKYDSRNPLSRFLVGGFIRNFNNLLDASGNPKCIAEVGAGEGYLTELIVKKFPNSSVWASDISQYILNEARKKIKSKKVKLEKENIKHLSYKKNFFDLVVCCEVLEHVANPKKALVEIRRVTKKMALVSVPQEPIWRILNILRLKYLGCRGNTPGHVNHWSRISFEKLIGKSGFHIFSRQYPFPWQMYLLEKRK